MARNGSGTMSVVNSFTPATTISSSAVNANFTDFASEVTNSVAVDGQSSMTGQLKAASGTAGAPGLSFAADTNTGFYRKGSDNIGVALGGADVGEWTTAGMVLASGKTIGGTDVIGATQLAANSVTLAKMATQADGTILANISGGTAVPTAATITSVFDKISSTQGVIAYRGASTWSALAVGTSGQFLKTQGAGANPAWASISEVPNQSGAAGKVLQSDGTTATWQMAIPVHGSFNSSGTLASGSLNVTSVTRVSVGVYDVVCPSGKLPSNYKVAGNSTWAQVPGVTGFSVTQKTSTGFRITVNAATIGDVDAACDFFAIG